MRMAGGGLGGGEGGGGEGGDGGLGGGGLGGARLEIQVRRLHRVRGAGARLYLKVASS
eukprot:CAMPEP_0181182514 /NCGR_PEP_ID=MMETSP1096-20121128/7931_1 /TAXON_ID=156174 ORGANISM="Chrysochromulina ericina, Strain CCMP281" /NCGR_SAMPLE_ID=MMETSP1096 /ASSEMBLY_ACC=CAM_ASM_000453 /LENGTH=57 /DNA_ID=CAMNT_0023271129 /DNA_START=940 /DNA_END=1113 /DNA_ORIENTATION=-